MDTSIDEDFDSEKYAVADSDIGFGKIFRLIDSGLLSGGDETAPSHTVMQVFGVASSIILQEHAGLVSCYHDSCPAIIKVAI